jgi:hypothetical protein
LQGLRKNINKDAFSVLFLKEKNQKNFLWVLIFGFDIIRSNIPFGSLDVCVPNKIDDGTTAKPHVRLGLKTYYSNVGATIGRPQHRLSPHRMRSCGVSFDKEFT